MQLKYAALLLLLGTPALRAEEPPLTETILTDAELRSAIAAAPVLPHPPFPAGAYRYQISPKSDFPIYGARMTSPGEAELHAEFSDVWYIIDGAGTMTIGGTVVEGRTISPGEIRGPSIANGTPRQLHKGDLVVIPSGIPHGMTGITGKEIVYFIVKVPNLVLVQR